VVKSPADIGVAMKEALRGAARTQTEN
jgi:hypothetical protein